MHFRLSSYSVQNPALVYPLFIPKTPPIPRKIIVTQPLNIRFLFIVVSLGLDMSYFHRQSQSCRSVACLDRLSSSKITRRGVNTRNVQLTQEIPRKREKEKNLTSRQYLHACRQL